MDAHKGLKELKQIKTNYRITHLRVLLPRVDEGGHDNLIAIRELIRPSLRENSCPGYDEVSFYTKFARSQLLKVTK